jgi:3-oxoadipate enol-lactonase
MPTVSTNGIEMYYEREGSGEPLLLVPGLLFGAEHWRPQMDVLASDYDVIAIDLRGQYHTTTTHDIAGYDMWNQTEDVYGLIQVLGIAPTHFAGLSMGGFIGMRMALKHPEVLRDLILIDTQSGVDESEKTDLYAAMRAVWRGGQLEALESALPKSFFTDEFIAGHPEEVAAWISRLKENDPEGSPNASEGVDTRDDITDRLGEIKLPTLVAHGTEDIAIEIEKGELLANKIPGAKFVRIEGAAHQSNVSHPEEVTGLIRDFLAEVRAGAPAGRAG